MNHNKSSEISRIAIFFAVMLVIHFISSWFFYIWPVPIKPTLVHIPVIVASIMYGPRTGAILGGLMGIVSVITNTLVLLPTSHLFSPFVTNGNLASLMIAMLPRILIGITPYYCYKLIKNELGLVLAGLVGSLTNTIFVLSGIFIFFPTASGDNVKTFLTTIVSGNAITEMIVSAIVTITLIPALSKLKKS
ncbi:ECF transporter S component [Streptococcus equi]|nr:ECF transporter S component [Streptococcus equi]ASB96703.1 membrane protein [Streptococcus equi subsp. equi]MBT1195861.1 ECF transporter S component [Streptococcus equi subsp. equi]MBT1196298.1 ECF transporter S component [Streptococcus equi subsp. equi]MBT1198990.1 ECF transporter S component [Streptococcus equi subsp. equi]MBT1200827.1 ECF transporter S component [Streptococcus equi subsp. equi]